MLEFIIWYLLITFAGLLALPVAFRLLPYLADRGYTLARTLGLLLWGFIFWLLASLHLLQNDLGGVLVALLLLAGLSVWASRGLEGWREIAAWFTTRARLALVTEVLFLAAFAFLAVLRAAGPEISGTEKPMELAFINAILRSPSFPPADPWLSGYSISYYYFGYVLVAMLARLSGVSAGVAFNLGIALVFALAALGSYEVVYSLLARWSRWRQEQGRAGFFSQGWALFAPLLLLLVSNLEGGFEVLHARQAFWQQADRTLAKQSQFWSWLGLLELNQPPSGTPTWEPNRPGGIWWWRASRVVQDYNLANPLDQALPGIPQSAYFPPESQPIEVIDEFPFFSFYLADLHPHVLGLPFGLLAVGLALNLYLRGASESLRKLTLRSWPQRPEFWLAAVGLGSLAFFNTWDFPIYVALFAAAYAYVRFSQLGWDWKARLADFVGLALALGVSGILLYLPFYVGFSSQAGGILPSLAFFTRGLHFWIMFGALLVPVCAWLFWLARRQGPAHRFGEGLRFAGWVVGGLLVVSTVLGLLGLNLAAMGSLAQGKLAQSLANWGSLFYGLQGGSDAADVLMGALSRRIALPGTWLTLFLMAAGCWALLASYRPAAAVNESEPEDAEQAVVEAAAAEPVSSGDPNGFVLLLVLVGTGLTLAPEFVYLRDQFGTRMNTIFKLYYQAWVVWSLAAAFGTVILWNEMRGWGGTLAKTAWTVVFLAGLAYPSFGIAQRLDFSQAERWTLDGTAYLDEYEPGEKGAMDFLTQAPYGVVAEAVGGSYSSAARMSTHSGLPAVLGWPGHESQWRGGALEMGSRADDLSTLYRTRDWNEARRVVARYNIRYIVVGSLEANTYRADDRQGLRALDESKFQKNLKVAYQSGGVTIYETASQ